MSMSPAERARVQLDDLRAGFGARLRGRVEQLAVLVERARASTSPEALSEAVGAAHRLTGTAASYGFVDVSNATAALEQALGRMTSGDRTGGESEWELALAALSRARRAAF